MIRKARPTEYRGVRYRSKSEACLAKLLDDRGWLLEYEPAWLAVGGWKPDFAAWSVADARDWDVPVGQFRPLLWIIEYKPSDVTPTYRRELERRFNAVRLRIGGLPHWFCKLMMGSFWDEDGRKAEFWSGRAWVPVAGEWAGPDEVKAIRAHRFDLKATV
jgi:hypothetical protein